MLPRLQSIHGISAILCDISKCSLATRILVRTQRVWCSGMFLVFTGASEYFQCIGALVYSRNVLGVSRVFASAVVCSLAQWCVRCDGGVFAASPAPEAEIP